MILFLVYQNQIQKNQNQATANFDHENRLKCGIPVKGLKLFIILERARHQAC